MENKEIDELTTYINDYIKDNPTISITTMIEEIEKFCYPTRYAYSRDFWPELLNSELLYAFRKYNKVRNEISYDK